MEVYAAVSRRIRALFEALTPLVEPLSLDEAFLDLTGTARLHGEPPARVLARLQRRVEAELGVTVSIGLSHNKYLAKMASELDKPRGFSVVGRADTERFLAGKPVGVIWGVGPSMAEALAADAIRTIDDLRARGHDALMARHGAMGARLHDLAWGRDARLVSPDRRAKSLSSETTFDTDIADPDLLRAHLWRLAVKVSDRLKAKDIAGRVLVLKVKRHDFQTLTRRRSLGGPTQLADTIYREGAALLDAALSSAPFRLIGVGLTELGAPGGEVGDLLDPDAARRAQAERAADAIRGRFGDGAIVKGRGLLADR
jgi:DNA polymerase-4